MEVLQYCKSVVEHYESGHGLELLPLVSGAVAKEFTIRASLSPRKVWTFSLQITVFDFASLLTNYSSPV